MKIKLAILESDKNYLDRIVSVFSTKYAEKFQIYSFTNHDLAVNSVNYDKIDVFMADDSFEIDVTALPERCTFVYLVSSSDIDTIREQRAICKFQKAELIYKQILSAYSENVGSLTGLKLADNECQVTVFSSPSGGVGTSTVAAAYAVYLAKHDQKVIYLNFEDFGGTDMFFSADGQFCMSDVIFALKSKKANLALKLESYVKQDVTGVNFFSSANFSLDMLEFKHEERLQLINELKLLGSYDHMVIDVGFGLDKNSFDYYNASHNVVLISDGSEISNIKTLNAFNALITIDQSADVPVANRFSLLYNRFSSKTGKVLNEISFRNIGGFPVYAQATTAQIISQLSNNNVFDKLD